MGRVVKIVSLVVGIFLAAVIGLLLYAYFNLNSIIASNRGYILAHAGDAIGRPVEASDIKASIGWGVQMDVQGVKVADDPAISQIPFLQARDVYVNVEFVPLLARSLKVTSLVIQNPVVRLIKDRSGVLNVSTIGQKSAEPREQKKKPGNGAGGGNNGAALAALTVNSLKIKDGQIIYKDEASGSAPVQVNGFNLDVENFSVRSPFDIAMTLAAFGDRKNLDISGTVGPLMTDGALDIDKVPLNLTAVLGPLSVAQLKAVPQLAKSIPAGLDISQPLTINAKIGGTVGATHLDASGDLGPAHVVYAGVLDKPAGVPMRFDAAAERQNANIRISRANIVLADAAVKASNVTLNGGNIAARIDSNSFDLGGIGKILVAAQKYNPTGKAEIHANLAVASHKPSINGNLKLTKVNAVVPGATTPPLHDLSGDIRMAGNTATVGPLDFNLGSGHARLSAVAQSIQPLHATYQFNSDVIKIGELVPSRQQLGEQMTGVVAAGTLSRAASGDISATTDVKSASGMVANVPYGNLALIAAYANDRANITSLKLNAFDGSVTASGQAALGSDRNFNLKLTADNIDVQKALEAQKAKASETLRGRLTGNLQVAGAGSSLDQIKPTLRGNGGANLKNGKLVGINVVAQALRRVDNLPGIGALVPASVVSNHPALFRSNDTDIQNASLTFTLQGPRMITHDLNAAAADYTILGDGWFDMDKNIDLAARILMSKAFSNEMVGAKHNIVYLTNADGRIELPLRISGQLPKPAVLPDVNVLAQRAASHAIQNRVGSLLGKKGGALGGLLGGGKESSGGTAKPSSTPNPLDQLKGLFH